MTRLKIGVLITLVAALFLWVKDFFGPSVPQGPVTLEEGEETRVTVAHNVVTATTKQGTIKKYLPSAGSATVSVKEDGVVTLETKNKGASLQLGGGIGYDNQPRITLDLQTLYWNRLGGHLGLGFGRVQPIVVPFVAASYRLDQLRLDNSSVMVGITLNKDPFVGVRWEF
jgi:hypothetical protein